MTVMMCLVMTGIIAWSAWRAKSDTSLSERIDIEGSLLFREFLKDAEVAEGYEHTVYRDTLGYLTVGIGHRVTPADNLKVGDSIDDARIVALFRKDYQKVYASLERYYPEWRSWPLLAQLATANFLYQLGADAPKSFPRATTFLNHKMWTDAANEWLYADKSKLRHSKWYMETPHRCLQEVNRLRAVVTQHEHSDL